MLCRRQSCRAKKPLTLFWRTVILFAVISPLKLAGPDSGCEGSVLRGGGLSSMNRPHSAPHGWFSPRLASVNCAHVHDRHLSHHGTMSARKGGHH